MDSSLVIISKPPSAERLDLLPFDIQLHIMQYLRDVDLDSLARVNRFYGILTKEPEVWRQLYARYRQTLNVRLDPDSRIARESLVQRNIFKGIFGYQLRSGHYLNTPHIRLQLRVRQLFLKSRLDSFLARRPELDRLKSERPSVFRPLGMGRNCRGVSPLLAPLISKLSLEMTTNRVNRKLRNRRALDLHIEEKFNSHLLEEQRTYFSSKVADDGANHEQEEHEEEEERGQSWGIMMLQQQQPDHDNTFASNSYTNSPPLPSAVSASPSPRIFATQLQLARRLNKIKISRFLRRKQPAGNSSSLALALQRSNPAQTYERLLRDHFDEEGEFVHKVTDSRPSVISLVEKNVLELRPLQFAQIICPAIAPKINYFEHLGEGE